jgi:16S rRNA (cytidine1402-2'-O)-methyltransferase
VYPRDRLPIPSQSEAPSEAAQGGLLYVVATPIGNPEDITARALRILREADLIACEDTRLTGRLLALHGIQAATVSYFEHNEERRTPELITRLRNGATIALVSDAGTPGVSDPGYRLVRAALDAGIRVSSVPGPSAVISALAISGLATDRFVFEGFLPAKAGPRREALRRLSREPRTIIFYEAARRLLETLESMADAFGDRHSAAVLRELTKTHEETRRGTLAELVDHFRRSTALGEVTIVVAGRDDKAAGSHLDDKLDQDAAIEMLRGKGLTARDASEIIAKLTGARRRDVYQRVIARAAKKS